MDWSRLTTISTFDDGFLHNNLILSSCPSLYMNNDPRELTTVKPTTAISLLIEGLVQLICKLIEDDNRNVDISYRKICEKLNSMILIDDSYARNEFADMREYYEKQIYQIICAVHHKLPIEFTKFKHPYISTGLFSRYKREFEEVRFIASGGFGKVFQVRHKLDSLDYAVKQIKINSTKIELNHFAEVKTLASLNHPNIVQYKSAWLEPILPKINEKAEHANESHDASELIRSAKSENESLSGNSNSLKLVKYNCNYKPHYSTAENTILYIQMSLCKLTLQEWLFDRNSSNNVNSYYVESLKTMNKISPLKIVHNIFCQILEGLNYIHSKKIIHHDIKPSNIFLNFSENGDIIAQLGDFGLACPLQDDHRGYPLGTKLYAAPEQLQGECHPKSDVYSLGIVLLELLIPYKTDMERIKIIENARRGIFLSELTIPSVHILRSLLNSKNRRPTAKEVLKLVRKFNLDENVSLKQYESEERSMESMKEVLKLLPKFNLDDNVSVKEEKTEDIENELPILNTYEIEIRCLKNDIIQKNQQIHDLNATLLAKNMEINQLKNFLKPKVDKYTINDLV